MRLVTTIFVVLLMVVGVAVFANGHHVVPPPAQPSGAGPSTETIPPSTTPPPAEMPATTVPSVTVPATSSEVEMFNTNNCVSQFNVDRTSVQQLRANGWTWGDIYMMSNIANKTHRPLLEIANLRSQNLAWVDIANRYNLTALDITSSPVIMTRVAGYTAEYGYMPIYYRTDPWGNPVLTRYDAERLSRLGYSWQDIAVATNISARTGARVDDVLAWTDRGYTWPQIAREYGLSPRRIMDVSQYPFARVPGTRGPAVNTAPVGAGPMYPMYQQAPFNPNSTDQNLNMSPGPPTY
jgi:hypothetical protein